MTIAEKKENWFKFPDVSLWSLWCSVDIWHQWWNSPHISDIYIYTCTLNIQFVFDITWYKCNGLNCINHANLAMTLYVLENKIHVNYGNEYFALIIIMQVWIINCQCLYHKPSSTTHSHHSCCIFLTLDIKKSW